MPRVIESCKLVTVNGINITAAVRAVDIRREAGAIAMATIELYCDTVEQNRDEIELDLGKDTVIVDMVLHCPVCKAKHVDGADGMGYQDVPHRSHLCHICGCIFRPADVCTRGVANTKTHGKNDTPTNAHGYGWVRE